MKTLPFILIILAAPAAAQTISLPANCSAFLTVQSQSCSVAHHFTCAGDPEGYRHRVEFYGDGYDFVSTIDADGQWMASNDVYGGGYEVLGAVVTDPLSVSGLIETGRDTMDFTQEHSNGAVTRYVGDESMTGATTVIDGITLLDAAYELAAFDATGAEIWRSTGTEFISPGWRLYFSEVTTWFEAGYDPNVVPGAPVDFIRPGEPGFLSTVPLYDCDTAE